MRTGEAPWLLVLMALSAVTATSRGQGLFEPPQFYPVGEGPQGVTVADFDGDGWNDIATANSDAGTVSVLYRQSNGQYSPPDSYVVGRDPYGVVHGDFNQDKRMDLVVGNGGQLDVMLMYGLASGGFGPLVPYAVGAAPRSILTRDFNGDDLPDLATANSESNNVTVLYGQVGGGLGTRADYPVGRDPWGLAAADFDRDGRLDLVTSNRDDSDVSVLYGQAGGFGGRRDYTTEYYAQDVTVGDFNRDDLVDLAVTTNGLADRRLNILSGQLGGGFASHINHPAPYLPLKIIACDFDLDGVLDLASACYGYGLILWRGLPEGGFAPYETYPAGHEPMQLAAEDLDRDGWPDIVLTNQRDDTVAVFYNAIPEPATLSLLALGGALVALGRGRRRGTRQGA